METSSWVKEYETDYNIIVHIATKKKNISQMIMWKNSNIGSYNRRYDAEEVLTKVKIKGTAQKEVRIAFIF